MPEVVLGAQGGSSAYLPTPTWPISSLAPSSHQTRNMVTNSPKTGDQTSGKVLGTRHSSRKPQSSAAWWFLYCEDYEDLNWQSYFMRHGLDAELHVLLAYHGSTPTLQLQNVNSTFKVGDYSVCYSTKPGYY